MKNQLRNLITRFYLSESNKSIPVMQITKKPDYSKSERLKQESSGIRTSNNQINLKTNR